MATVNPTPDDLAKARYELIRDTLRATVNGNPQGRKLIGDSALDLPMYMSFAKGLEVGLREYLPEGSLKGEKSLRLSDAVKDQMDRANSRIRDVSEAIFKLESDDNYKKHAVSDHLLQGLKGTLSDYRAELDAARNLGSRLNRRLTDYRAYRFVKDGIVQGEKETWEGHKPDWFLNKGLIAAGFGLAALCYAVHGCKDKTGPTPGPTSSPTQVIIVPPTSIPTKPAGGTTVTSVDRPPVIDSLEKKVQKDGSYTLSLKAHDDKGIANVRLYVDGTKFGEDNSAPYILSTPKFKQGETHKLKVEVIDTKGQSAYKEITIKIPKPEGPVTGPRATATPAEEGDLNLQGEGFTAPPPLEKKP